jgi:O-methyltransferase domain/Dimerisation domain
VTATTAPNELMRLINGYQVSQALHVAATLGVADQLKDGPKSYDAVARACGAHPASLYRLLRALAAVGVFHEADNKEFSLTSLGVSLTSDATGSARNYARWVGTPGQWRAWGSLLHTIQSGECAQQFACGTDAWTYRSEHPDEQAIFNSAMTGNSRLEAQAALEAYDFSRFGCIVDVGGGQGLLLKTILTACHAPHAILFDQPQVISSADCALASGHLAHRCQIVAGNFFEAVPVDGDAYVMKAILHDWDDQRAAAILRTCRRAMSPAATLFVIERVVGSPNELPEGKFSDLNMMVQYAALERTRHEFRDLLGNSGFEMTEVIPTSSPLSIVVARPMPAKGNGE